MQVTFYQTKLSTQNRCYDEDTYLSYLNSCEQRYVTLNYDIIPNQPFNVSFKLLSNIYKFNYITYTLSDLTYGAFIDKIEVLATEEDGTNVVRVYQTTDNWYFALKNTSFDFHGEMIRGHVNDLVHNTVVGRYEADFSNTYMTQEETFNQSNVRNIKLSMTDATDYEPTANNYKYIYIYLNNPKRPNLSISNLEQKYRRMGQGNNELFIQSVGYVIVGAISLDSGYCYFIHRPPRYSQSYSSREVIQLKDLTNSYITAMCISEIPPTPTTKIVVDSVDVGDTTITVPNIVDDSTVAYIQYTAQDGSFPERAFGYHELFMTAPFYPVTSYNNPCGREIQDFRLRKLWFNNLEATYENYLKKGVMKVLSQAYNPLFIDDMFVDINKIPETNLYLTRIYLSPDLTYYLVEVFQTNLEGRSRYCVRNNLAVFTPDTVNDYWTQLNAHRTSISAGKTIANSVMNVVSSGAALGAGIATDNLGKTISSAASLASSVVNLGFDSALTDIDLQMARNQKVSGNVSNDIPSGYYIHANGGATPTAQLFVQDEQNIISIATRLHRYGYATNIQLDTAYRNHRRENFNYFQVKNCEINGVPTDIAEDLRSMFTVGVHLWSGKVEDWEVTNYQVNL